jgi:hypothetical protein
MNHTRGRRSLRTALADWLRALLRRTPTRPDPDAAPQKTGSIDAVSTDAQESAGFAETAGTFQAETSPGKRNGPPEHWLALARSKGPPQHWLDLIRARLGDDLSKVPWIRARAIPREAPRAEPHSAPFPPNNEERPALPVNEPPEAFSAHENQEGEPSWEEEPAPRPVVKARPAFERRPPAAMRIYPAPAAEPKLPAAEPRPAPLPQVQTYGRPETVLPPAPQANPVPVSRPEAQTGRPPEGLESPFMPIAPPGPGRSQSPAPWASPKPVARERAAQETQAEQEPAMQEQAVPQATHWPPWEASTFTIPLPPVEPYTAAPEPRFEAEPRATGRSNWPHPLPSPQTYETTEEPSAGPSTWPASFEPAPAERRADRDLPARLAPIDRWPALERIEDDDLAGDEWESYQRNWQRLERLRREQQGQIWSEWPF